MPSVGVKDTDSNRSTEPRVATIKSPVKAMIIPITCMMVGLTRQKRAKRIKVKAGKVAKMIAALIAGLKRGRGRI